MTVRIEGRTDFLCANNSNFRRTKMKWNDESAMILSAFENRLRAGFNTPYKQIQPLSRIKKNIKYSESP